MKGKIRNVISKTPLKIQVNAFFPFFRQVMFVLFDVQKQMIKLDSDFVLK